MRSFFAWFASFGKGGGWKLSSREVWWRIQTGPPTSMISIQSPGFFISSGVGAVISVMSGTGFRVASLSGTGARVAISGSAGSRVATSTSIPKVGFGVVGQCPGVSLSTKLGVGLGLTSGSIGTLVGGAVLETIGKVGLGDGLGVLETMSKVGFGGVGVSLGDGLGAGDSVGDADGARSSVVGGTGLGVVGLGVTETIGKGLRVGLRVGGGACKVKSNG